MTMILTMPPFTGTCIFLIGLIKLDLFVYVGQIRALIEISLSRFLTLTHSYSYKILIFYELFKILLHNLINKHNKKFWKFKIIEAI